MEKKIEETPPPYGVVGFLLTHFLFECINQTANYINNIGEQYDTSDFLSKEKRILVSS